MHQHRPLKSCLSQAASLGQPMAHAVYQPPLPDLASQFEMTSDYEYVVASDIVLTVVRPGRGEGHIYLPAPGSSRRGRSIKVVDLAIISAYYHSLGER